MQAAAAGIGYVCLDCKYLKFMHELFCCRSSALHAEGNNSACPVRHILLSDVIVLVARKSRICDRLDFITLGKEFCQSETVRTVLLHAHMKTLETDIEDIRVLRRLDGTEVTHELGCSLCDESSSKAELLSVNDAMIAVIRRCESGETLSMCKPVELA